MASSLTTASLSAIPIITTMPIKLTALSDCPVSHRKITAPAPASGTVSMTTSGMVKLANSPANTKNISSAASTATNVSSLLVRARSASAPPTCHDTPAGSVSAAMRDCTSVVALAVPPLSTSPSMMVTGRCPTRTTSNGARVSRTCTSCANGTPRSGVLSAVSSSSLRRPA